MGSRSRAVAHRDTECCSLLLRYLEGLEAAEAAVPVDRGSGKALGKVPDWHSVARTVEAPSALGGHTARRSRWKTGTVAERAGEAAAHTWEIIRQSWK